MWNDCNIPHADHLGWRCRPLLLFTPVVAVLITCSSVSHLARMHRVPSVRAQNTLSKLSLYLDCALLRFSPGVTESNTSLHCLPRPLRLPAKPTELQSLTYLRNKNINVFHPLEALMQS